MRTLTEFLRENVVMPDNIFAPVSKRFADKDGNPVQWEIRAVTYGEDEEIRRNSTKQIKAGSGRGDYISELDKLDYMLKLIVRSVVFPNLNDADLQNSYGVMGADNLVREMLSPGEFLRLTNLVMQLNSMLPTFNDEFDEARDLLERGEFEAEVAFFCLQKFNILPSKILSLPRRERAFILAAIEKMSNK